MHPKARVVTAPAKVNLYLAVGATRPDGYHDIETVLQAISLADRVVIEPAEELSLHVSVDLGIPAEENLAYRAASQLLQEAGVQGGAKITLHKSIPAGAGLGGGSSDAAATLVGLADLLGIAEDIVLEDLAADLGSDVPFFLHGGAAHFSGRGDKLRHRAPAPDMMFALVKPPVEVFTAEAYRSFDLLDHAIAPAVDKMIHAVSANDTHAIAAALHNNMADASIGLEPQVGEAITLCETIDGVVGTTMAGSGSAVFCIVENEAVATEVTKSARARGWWAEVACAIDHGVRAHAAEEAM